MQPQIIPELIAQQEEAEEEEEKVPDMGERGRTSMVGKKIGKPEILGKRSESKKPGQKSVPPIRNTKPNQ